HCPPSWRLDLTRDMPTPGWAMKATIKRNDADKILRVEITATPPHGLVPQVITKGTVRVEAGSLLKGAWLVDVHYKAGGEKSRRVQAFTLRAS
ncbi:MAG: hypothetical protein OER88_14025, partial [Planctomycetota bacterium]|nr:hypothetical protein [Planctomycetota bacterium]